MPFDPSPRTHNRTGSPRRAVRHTLLALVCLCVLPVLGCAIFGSPTPIVVTATPSPEPTETPRPVTPIPTPTPTPLPVPTVVPFQAIVQANAALQNGDYISAVAIYKAILDQPVLSVDPNLRMDAAYGMGVAELREGKFAEAVTALTWFIDNFPNEARVAQAHFMRGDAYLGTSEWAAAIADFKIYVQKRPGLVDSYAYERIGDANLALGDPAQALTNYDLAVQSQRGLVPLLVLREKLAAGYLNAGNLSAAIAQYDAILSVARNNGYRASIALAAADVLLRSGNTATAYARYQDIVRNYPETIFAYRAMQALLRAGNSVDNLTRGRISFAAKDYNDAITALHQYTSATPLAQIDPQVYMLLGRAYREVNNVAAANTSFQTIITQYPTSAQFGEAWLEQGRTLFLAGDVAGAIAKYIELADKHPTVTQGADALWRAGYLYSTLGNLEQSLATFEILGNKFPGTEQAMDGLFRAGMAAYGQNQPARAQRLFALLANTGSGELKAAGYFWLGRLYQIENQTQLARDAYGEAAKADVEGYYSLRAADMLAGQGPYVPPAGLDWDFSSPARIAEAETWMREKFQIVGGGALWPLSPEQANDARMIRGSELWALANYDDAKAEFSQLTQDNERNPLALYQLASYYYRIGHYYEAIIAAAKLLDGAKVPTTQAPKYIAALRYPIAFYDLVLPATEKYKVDPLLVFSLIRQESLFQGAATSSAQAQGLMQVIPDTGIYIATKLQWPDYQNSDLYRPFVNVAFGVYYLHEQLQTFSNTPAALAAYNAGPGQAGEWLRMSNGDPDLLMQAVSFDETRAYVRRIYEQYKVYATIYAAR